MNQLTVKSRLLETLCTRRGHWEALLTTVGEDHMIQPGVAGHWSVKNIVSHITAYERWLVDWLTAASQNTFPAPSALDSADIEERNRRVYELTHELPLHEVLSDACQNFIKLLKIIKALPDKYFDDPQSAEWFMKPYWRQMKTIPEAVINLSADHYDEHIPALEAWIVIKQAKEKQK